MFNRIIFFEDGAGEGGGGNLGDPNTPPQIPEEIQRELDELRNFKKSVAEKQPELTPEQIAKNQEIEKADFRKMAIERDLLKDEDFTRYETLQQKKDLELVKEDFEREFREKNPEAELEDIEDAFNQQYHLNSENEVLKNRGLKLLEKDAKEIRNPYETKYKSAQDIYNQEKDVKATVPEFNKFIDDVIKDSTPDKLPFKVKDGDQEIEIDTELSEEQRKEIEKIFKNNKTFYSFVTSKDKREELKSQIAKKITGYIKINNFDKAAQKSFEVGVGIGTKRGSDAGAQNPFPLNQGSGAPGAGTSKKSLEESNEKIANARRSARR